MPNGIHARWLVVAALLVAARAIGAHAAAAREESAGLPRGFVYLRDVAPEIAQDIRYAGAGNFVGRAVEGYEAAECVLTRQAAAAIKRAHEKLREKGLGLKVLDCYRPARAVEDFVEWSGEGGREPTKAYYYPTIPKRSLFALGYVSSHSTHSAGSTVDLTLVPYPAPAEAPAERTPDGPCFATSVYLQGPLDMGSDFDCFHPKSHFHAVGISAAARANRDLLRETMQDEGFVPLGTEWWHFRLADEPFAWRRFDFPITPRGGK